MTYWRIGLQGIGLSNKTLPLLIGCVPAVCGIWDQALVYDAAEPPVFL